MARVKSKTKDTTKYKTPDVAEDDLRLDLILVRSYTRAMVRRYVYARHQAARIFHGLDRSLGPGMVRCRPIRTFEDALVFVVDMERCIARLDDFDQLILRRILVQNYTYGETAALVGMSLRSFSTRYLLALDRLSQKLIDFKLLYLPGGNPALAA